MGISRYDGLTQKDGETIRWTGKVRLVESALDLPLRWKKPRRIFVNSMSDLFHEKVPDQWIFDILKIIVAAPQHVYQVLTKRPERMLATIPEMYKSFRYHFDSPGPETPLRNLWLGVSVEDQATADARIPLLLQTPAAVRFVSLEPLLGPMDLRQYVRPTKGFIVPYYANLNWVIVGGESGPGARPFDLAWARSAIAQCRAAGVACFVKQLGAHPEQGIETVPLRMMSLGLRDRKGADPAEWPEDLRVREYPG